MAVSTPNLYPVILDDEQRQRLQEITRNGRAPAKKILHARVLLMSDRNRDGGPLTRGEIAGLLEIHVNSVDRIRKRFVLEGEEPAINRKPRLTPPVAPKIDGHAEAFLIAMCCSRRPEGRTRWTLSLLAEELKKNRYVTSVCAETVRKALKKTNCSLGGSNAGACRNAIAPGLSPKWKRSSMSTPPNIRKKSH